MKSDKKYDGMFGVTMHGSLMEPRLRDGYKLWIMPHLKPKLGDEVVVHTGDDEDGGYVVGILKKETRARWYVNQLNPYAVFRLPKKDWPHCDMVGAIDRAPDLSTRRRRSAA
jgi:phage repressor protein C with HTH and peptisase S24 domain